ncbi:copper chaperone PCu(A)C [Oxalobacteraceae bacterium]|nr:copper chaperone PCu(A)C [Oxalobacteraceae bacterium]
MKKQTIAFVLGLLASTCALAQSSAVSVRDPWVRATVAAAKSTGAFMQLQSERDVRLVSVRSPVAGVAEIHQMSMQGDMMKMQAVDGLDLPAGKPVNLASGGYHLMLMDLKRQLKEGETIPLTLQVQGKNKKTETISVDVPVRAINYAAPQGKH